MPLPGAIGDEECPRNASGARTRPTPDRARLAQAIQSSAPLEVVAEGMAAATEFTPLLVYVEQRGDRYRWSPAHRGGPYPLLRVMARFLGIDYHALVLPFRTLSRAKDPVCIVPGAEDDDGPPDSWTLLEFDAPQTASAVSELIRAFDVQKPGACRQTT